METVKLSKKGQIVIPKEIREAQCLVPGTKFLVSCVAGEIRLAPAPHFRRTRVEDGLGMLARRGRRRLRDEETERRIGELLKARDHATKR
jgi:AbrB family looped-hinge helix DNA binding protein